MKSRKCKAQDLFSGSSARKGAVFFSPPRICAATNPLRPRPHGFPSTKQHTRWVGLQESHRSGASAISLHEDQKYQIAVCAWRKAAVSSIATVQHTHFRACCIEKCSTPTRLLLDISTWAAGPLRLLQSPPSTDRLNACGHYRYVARRPQHEANLPERWNEPHR